MSAVPATESHEAPISLFNYPECTFTTTGLIIPEGMPFERWEALGTDLRKAAKGIQFWIGDWIRYGEHEYGEKYAQAIDATGNAEKTLRNYVFVAQNIPLSRRRDTDLVDYSTQAEVAGLPGREQERILRKAEREGLNRKQVRREVHRVKRQNGEKTEIESLHAPAVQEFLGRYIATVKEFEESVPVSAPFLRAMFQHHAAQANWQKERTFQEDCEIIQMAVKKSGGSIDENDLYQWLLDHGYFMSDPEFEARLEHMNRDDVRMALVTNAGEGKQEERRGKLPTIICVPWVKIWDQKSKRSRDDDDDADDEHF